MRTRVCLCGSDIEWQKLPPKLADLCHVSGFWKHVRGGDVYCYPDEPGERAIAEPAGS